MLRIVSILASLFLLVASGCHTAPNVGDVQSDTGKTHPKVGRVATFTTRFHGVSGTARISDNSTIVLENFNYDGGGLDVRIWIAKDGKNLAAGKRISNDIQRSGGYKNETLTFKLPVDVSLDDINWISVWCVSVAENFGEGEFK